MKGVLRLCFAAGFFLFATFGLQAQSGESTAKVQEDFALAVATAHARTSLFGAGSKPFAIHASVVSRLALHGTGNGTYENQWIDAQHWHRIIQFPDFHQQEMRNDSGHPWVDQSSDAMPLRISEMLRVVVIHVPSSTAASTINVSKTSTSGDQGESLTCYSASAPIPADGFPRRFRWCFEKESGLLVSQDMPLNTHIVYSNYITFQGKHEFTHVRVTSGSLPVLDIEIQYNPLDDHALDGSVPGGTMHRSASAESTPNPEELGKGSVEYSFNPPLPSGTPDADKNKAVQLLFRVSADNKVVDACAEDAPTQEMGEAALQAAQKFTFAPLTVDGKPVGNVFYASVWFKLDANDTSLPGNGAEKQPGSGNTAHTTVPSEPKAGAVYHNKELSFAFRSPPGFEEIPKGELEEARRSESGSHHYGLEPGSECNTLLFRAQWLRPGALYPEVVSITDLAPTCIFGVFDQKALEVTAVNAAGSIVHQWAGGSVSKPKRYTLNGRTFAVVSASGIAHTTIEEQTNALIVVTTIHNHVVAWTFLGEKANHLEHALEGCTLQIDEGREGPLLPPS